MYPQEDLKAGVKMAVKTKKTIKKAAKDVAPLKNESTCIVFDCNARKTFVEGILQDIKGYFESKTNGLVEVTYEDYSLKNHEFGFKVFVAKGTKCKKQMFSETSSAIVNAVNYLFPGGNEQYDIAVFSEDSKLEFEIVSNW